MTDDFITDPELIEEVNSSIGEWWDEVTVSSWNGSYTRKRDNFTTTASSVASYAPAPGSYYPLPANYLRTISVDIAIGNNLVITAKAFQEEQRNVYRFYPVGAWVWNQPVFYQIQEQNIVFIPGPTGSFNVQHNYVPTAPKLARPADTLDCINAGFDEFIVLDVAQKLALKDGQLELMQVLVGERERQRARIKSQVPKRDMQTSEMIHEANEFDDQWIL